MKDEQKDLGADAFILKQRRASAAAAAARSARRPSLEQRFWAKVQKSDGCWEWQGYINSRGYGELSEREDQTPFRAHRLSWMLHFGEIPQGRMVCHHCDNRKCVNPSHLFVGTHTDNMRDGKAKGRIYQAHQLPQRSKETGRWTSK